MTELMDSPLLAPLADLLTPDKVETLQEMARVFYSNRSDISIARHCFSLLRSAKIKGCKVGSVGKNATTL